MSHFARIDADGIVQEVIVIDQTELQTGRWGDPASWVQTSYNGNIRVRFAGVGFRYDREADAFIPPRPFPSWTFDAAALDWVAPVAKPEGEDWYWNEEAHQWQAVVS